MAGTATQSTIRTNEGFTLVEMAVVLAIIALLIGAILGGENMIRATRIKSVGMDVLRYQQAAVSFRDRFKALPGDMVNATSEWGLAGGTTAANDATCNTVSSAGLTATCNGNGNNKIDVVYESFRFWQQLSAAKLIEGTYTGIADGAAANYHVAGENAPVFRITAVTAGVNYSSTSLASTRLYAIIPNNYFIVGGQKASQGYPRGDLFSPVEMQTLDTKMDDGVPGTGQFIAADWSTCTNSASNTDVTNSYKLSDHASDCYFLWTNVF